MDPAARSDRGSAHEAEEFVRFCYRRRRVGWPDLYDEMCAVANRGSYKGMGLGDLAEIGIGFSLVETPPLASLVSRVVAEEQAARARLSPNVVVRSARQPEAARNEEPEIRSAPAIAAATA